MNTAYVLDQAADFLKRIQRSGSTTTTTRWSIPVEQPLCTVWSEGESQRDKKSGFHARAEFSFCWEIRALDEVQWAGRRHFLLDGLASSVTRIVSKEGATLACWSTDVGDHQSPGTHFHAQFNHFDAPPFPKGFDVPRLPALPMSPFLAFEYAIGELFQDRWAKHAASDSHDMQQWRGIQAPRLEKFFEWQTQQMREQRTGSPWMTLKLLKPAPNLWV
ncbi:hypothetical protein [Variovorax sp. DXTD-1]|uniref:hypothetical protein n=1 Tax=Variovorax sp. DXTD-1 TaxID=2495592 RepID=UPI000F8904F3|nr:hypothetical protein [Variovorax sp. DXTD-1]RST53358.1 hypothetical protein EJI00_03640 [Variovorax sp. DXTD-1]